MAALTANAQSSQARSKAAAQDHGGVKRRYFDRKYNAWIVKVLPGECYTTADPDEVLVTILGSCVSACIRDTRRHIGGMNHFMLPEGASAAWGGTDYAMRYGNHAMESLINALLKHGARKSDLEIKVFGGGSVIQSSSDVGSKNAQFVKSYLQKEGLVAVSEDLGGEAARRIHYYPATGKVMRRLLIETSHTAIEQDEREYRRSLSHTPECGDIELFD